MADENLPDSGAGDGGAPPAETSLHDDIARAFEQVETRDAPPEADPSKPSSPVVPPEGPPPTGERARGPDGRFIASPAEAPRAGAEKAQATPAAAPGANGAKPPATAQKAPEAPPLEPPPQLRPPSSWKPGAREHWAKLPVEVQQEVSRRETEVARSLQESANASSALAHVQATLGPFAQNVAASGM